MAAIQKFTEIKAWQKAHELVLAVYKVTESFPKSEIFSLTSQIRRAAVSVPSNIVEGFKRSTKNDSLRFYNIAEGSLEELKYQLLLARELGYIQQPKAYSKIEAIMDEAGKLIYGWKRVQK